MENKVEVRGRAKPVVAVDGKSAYELAVMKGFSGTLEEWLESLRAKSTEQAIAAAERAEAAEKNAVKSVEAAESDAVAHIAGLAEGAYDIVQTKGDSETKVMSQKATTDNIEAILSAFETEGGYNLLDPSNAESGYYTNQSGVLTPTAGSAQQRTITPIPVVGGATLYIKTNADNSERNICVMQLDESGAVVSQTNIKFSVAFSGVRNLSLTSRTTAIHIWQNGVSVGLSFANICVSNTEITEYEPYGSVKTPTAIKKEFLPNSPTGGDGGDSYAWKGAVSGKIVQLNDVSPNAHEVKVTCNGDVEPSGVTVLCCGKNLCPPSYTTTTKNGITFTDNGDGSITLNGTATANTAYTIFSLPIRTLPLGKYACKLFGLENFESDKIRASLYFNKDGSYYKSVGAVYGYGLPFEITEFVNLSAELVVASGATVNQLRVSPMICAGDIPTEFVQGVQSKTYTPTDSGEVIGVESIHPSMTMFTNTEDAMLDVEYDRDVSYVEQEVNSVKECISDIKNPASCKVIDNFQSVDGWYNEADTGIATSISSDTSNYLYGSQSVHFEGGIRKDNLGIDVQGREFRIKFKVNSIDTNAHLIFRVANDKTFINSPNYTNFSEWVLVKGSQNENTTSTPLGRWIELTLPWSAFKNAGVIPYISTINTIVIKSINGNCDVNIQMISLDEKRESKGIVTFTFDDGNVTDYTKAAPILGARGIAATAYIIPQYIQEGRSAFLTEEQVTSLKYDYNWDIEGHWAVEMGEMTEEELSQNFNSVKTYIKEKGLGNCDHFAYAGGDCGGAVEKIARRYFTTARTINQGLDSGIGSQNNTNYHRLPAVSAISDIKSANDFNQVLTRISRVAQHGGWLILVFHVIGDGDTSLYCSEQGLAQIADHAIASGVDIKTMHEVMRHR